MGGAPSILGNYSTPSERIPGEGGVDGVEAVLIQAVGSHLEPTLPSESRRGGQAQSQKRRLCKHVEKLIFARRDKNREGSAVYKGVTGKPVPRQCPWY
jgi:hypothetical protein